MPHTHEPHDEPHAHHEQQHDAIRQHPEGPRIEVRQALAPAQVADYLEALATAMRSGSVTVRVGERAAEMRVGPDIDLRLRAEQRFDNMNRIHLELTWVSTQLARGAGTLEILGAGQSNGLGTAAPGTPDQPASQGTITDATGLPAANSEQGQAAARSEADLSE